MDSKCALVLGNGNSRKLLGDPLDIGVEIFGCNAIYRDFIPDHIVAVDAKMLDELVANQVHTQTQVWTYLKSTTNWKSEFHFLPSPSGWASGPSAVWLAAYQGFATVYLAGFDFSGTTEHKFNNIYADTKNYRKSSDPATYYGNWIKQVKSAVDHFPSTKFIRLRSPDCLMLPAGFAANLIDLEFSLNQNPRFEPI